MSSSDKDPEDDPDIEDGEITDDDEEQPIPAAAAAAEPTPVPELNPATAGAQPTIPVVPNKSLGLGNVSDSDSIGASNKEAGEPNARERSSDRERSDEKEKFPDGREKGRNREGRKARDRGNREDKNHRHMTEAERSILHLRKREKMLREREKWDKHHRKDTDPLDDDFAKNIEKTLATILNKKEKEVAALSAGEEPKEEEKRGKKRKKEDRDKDRAKGKHNKRAVVESPHSEIDENEMLNIRSGSPGAEMRLHASAIVYGPPDHAMMSPPRSDESFNSAYSSDEREERAESYKTRRRQIKNRRKNKKDRRERDQRRANREDPLKGALQDSQGVCVFYLQGKCQKNDCPYSHEVSPPMKLELCKFYLMDCCAKGDNCSYMHSEFPCKFYHTGLQCSAGKECKFAHGKALSEGLKQILFKHIETAPRDILQGFPRLSRDEALNLINQTQKKLMNGTADQTTTSSSTSSATHNTTSAPSPPPPPQQQQQPGFGGAQSSMSGLGMYREDYDTADVARDSNEREQEGAKELKKNKSERLKNKKNSRWQKEQDGKQASGYQMKGFNNYGTDQDMRFSSNGDVDMRTLPSIPPTTTSTASISEKASLEIEPYQRGSQQVDVDIRTFTQDVDIRQAPPFPRSMPSSMDVDIRQIRFEDNKQNDSDSNSREEKRGSADGQSGGTANFELPPATRDLLARITANQKDNTVVDAPSAMESQQDGNDQSGNYDGQNINWYSDDDDDDENRLTIRVEEEEGHKRDREDSVGSTSEREASNQGEGGDEPMKSSFLSPPQINSKTADIVGKLGDLSKIDISAEVTKLLTSMSKNKPLPMPVHVPATSASTASASTSPKGEGNLSPKGGGDVPTDPRVGRQQSRTNSRPDIRQQDPRQQDPRLSDPRHRGHRSSTEVKEKEKKPDKMSIYEQGGIDMKKAALEIESEDFKSTLRPDIDLRNMTLPFKGMQNYTPATEIDASVNSHLPMIWKVVLVEIPRPDYTGLKLNINDAEKTGDPRLRKIFRLSVDEKESPASPKQSPKQSSGARVDPRLRKMEDKCHESKDILQLSYNQQLSMLQTSQFYQSLTSNQKLMLNQELAKSDQSGSGGSNDPVLNTLLASLNLLPQTPTSQNQMPIGPNAHMGAAVSILSNVTKMNPLLANQPLIGQQGLLGAAPGIPNIAPNLAQGMSSDYPMNFDPRGGGGGLLGNAPPGAGFGQFGGMDQQSAFGGGYNDDFYGGYDDSGNMGHPGSSMGGPQGGGNMGPRGGNFRQGRGYNNNNNRDGRRRGNRDGGFRGGRGNRNFNKRGGGRDKGDRGKGDRGRGDRGDRDRGRGHRGHSPS